MFIDCQSFQFPGNGLVPLPNIRNDFVVACIASHLAYFYPGELVTYMKHRDFKNQPSCEL